MFQLTIAVDDASMVSDLATIYAVVVHAEKATGALDVISATDWYLSQLMPFIGENITYFEASDLARLAGSLMRCANTIETYVSEAERELSNGSEA